MDGSDPIKRLARELGKLPGIGEKTATRLAFYILDQPGEYAEQLAQALVDVKKRIKLCEVCMNVTEQTPCRLCSDARREAHLLCVVASPTELYSVERTGGYRGQYHVLHGLLSPLDGLGPEHLKLRELITRLQTRPDRPAVQELIVATSPNVEGEATAVYIARLCRPLGVKVTRIASGLAVGGELEYADGIAITRAFESRREM